MGGVGLGRIKGLMDEKVKEAIFGKVEKEPFAKKFGIKLLELEEGYSKVEMKFTKDMENLLGLVHGGHCLP
jgi:acyl-CoA thioesterase